MLVSLLSLATVIGIGSAEELYNLDKFAQHLKKEDQKAKNSAWASEMAAMVAWLAAAGIARAVVSAWPIRRPFGAH